MSIDVAKTFGGTNPHNINPVPYTFRTLYYSNGVLNGEGGTGGGYYNFHTVRDYFLNTPDLTLKFQFFSSRNSDIYKNIYAKISMTEVMRTMVRIAEPIFAGFVETNDEENFLEISNQFYYELFWNETIYVSYDFWSNPKNYELADNTKEPDEIEYYKEKGGFDTWVKMSNKEDDKDIRFLHLATGIVCDIFQWTQKLIKVRWAEYKIENFANWFSYSIRWLVGSKTIRNAHNLLLKRVHVHGTKNLHKQREDIEERLESETSIMMHDNNQNLDIISKIFMDGNDLTALHMSIFNLLDRESYELGRVSNTNPKGDRYSTGENYKDITGIAARQKSVLKELRLFSIKVKKMWGIELNFAVNGIPQTEAIEEHQQPAANPNSDGKPDATAATSPSGK